MTKIVLRPEDDAFIEDGNDSFGCGYVNDDWHVYLIDKKRGEAYRLPDEYAETQISPPCGGYREGRIMVSLLGEIDLQYYHEFGEIAGMWGWLDLEGNEVIPPQYVYATNFFDDSAIVCKGDWMVDDQDRYWCQYEQWGIIDRNGNELVPCRYERTAWIDGTNRYILCQKGEWPNGHSCVYDIEKQKEIIQFESYYDFCYECYNCWLENDCLYFDETADDEENRDKRYMYIYDLKQEKWVKYREAYIKE